MNGAMWTAVAAVLVWVAAAIKKVVSSGNPVTIQAILKEIFTFN
jgi:hypothetical protein